MRVDDDHLAVQDAVRGFVQDRIAPNAARWKILVDNPARLFGFAAA